MTLRDPHLTELRSSEVDWHMMMNINSDGFANLKIRAVISKKILGGGLKNGASETSEKTLSRASGGTR